MMYAELEIGLDRTQPGAYRVGLRFTDPDSTNESGPKLAWGMHATFTTSICGLARRSPSDRPLRVLGGRCEW